MGYYDKDQTFPVPPSPTWNIQDGSKIRTFISCPRRYFYEYVLGWRPERTEIDLIFGSAWHEAMAHLLETDYSTANIKLAYDKFLTYLRQYISSDEDEIFHPKTPYRAFLALPFYAATWHQEDLNYEVVKTTDGRNLIEIGGKISLTDDLDVCFRMDSVIRKISNGLIRSREHKTGSPWHTWGTDFYLNAQTFIYYHVLNCLFDPQEVEGIEYNGVFFKKTVDDRKKDQKDPFRHFEVKRILVTYQPQMMNALLVSNVNVLRQIQREFGLLANCSESDPVFYAFNPLHASSCDAYRGCPYFDFCTNWPNPLQRIDQLPIGFKVEHWDPNKEPVNVEVNV